MATVIEGKILRDKIISNLKSKVNELGMKPTLAIILVGNNEASLRYIKQKGKTAEELGGVVKLIQFPEDVSQRQLEKEIEKLNKNSQINGIIIQLPIPEQLEKEKLIELIEPRKDVDGLNPDSDFRPATPLGVMEILKEYKVDLTEKTAVIFGRSNLVGSPLKVLLEDVGTKVIQIHSQTPIPVNNLSLQGDIIVSAVGRPKLITADMVKEGAVVIDVGINKDPDTGKLIGDVDFEGVSKKASLITPVPGGVGPLTVAMLMSNLVKAAVKQLTT